MTRNDYGLGDDRQRGQNRYGRDYERGDHGERREGFLEKTFDRIADKFSDRDDGRDPQGRDSDRYGQRRGYDAAGRDNDSLDDGMRRRYDVPREDRSREPWHGSGAWDDDYARGSGRSMGQGGFGDAHGSVFGSQPSQQGYGRMGVGSGRGMGMGSGLDDSRGAFGQQTFGQGFGLSGQKGSDFRAPKGYQRSDERIREDVCETLGRHPDVDPSDIEITVQSGEVTLSGTVDESRARRTAEEVIERMPGVKDVHNHIRVNRHGSSSSPQSGVMGSAGPSSSGTSSGTNLGTSSGTSLLVGTSTSEKPTPSGPLSTSSSAKSGLQGNAESRPAH